MSYEAEGTLVAKFETEQKSDKFKSREFVIQIESQYPQQIKFQLVQDQCDQIDGIKEGESVKVYFDLRGREWQGKYFTNLQAWRVNPIGHATKSLDEPARKAEPKKAEKPKDETPDDPSLFSDLPF